MDRAWMYDLARIDPVYIENVHHFVEEAMRHANREKKFDIFYHCVDCDNKIAWSDSKVVKSHLIKRGFKKSYTIWIAHDVIDNALHDIWVLDYDLRIRIPIFRCQWIKHPNGVNIDNYGITLVDLKNLGHKDDLWVLADRVA
jgi:hypothetical protein